MADSKTESYGCTEKKDKVCSLEDIGIAQFTTCAVMGDLPKVIDDLMPSSQ